MSTGQQHGRITNNPEQTRILFVNLTGGFGGVEVYTERLLSLLQNSARFYALVFEPELIVRLRKRKDICLLSVPFRNVLPKFMRILLGLPMLAWAILRHHIDVVQINGYSEAIYLPLARALGCTAITTRHLTFDIEKCPLPKSVERRLARFIYCVCARSASLIVAVSDAVGAEVRALIPAARVKVIPNWISSAPSDRCGRTLLQSPARLLYVGRLTELKGLHLLLEALRNVPDVRLTVVGDGPCRPELEQLAAKLDTEFAGFQKDPLPFYAAADIFINPSLGPEGSSLVALDAMARGVPCLLSDLPVFQEISDEGRAALLFRTGDVDDLRTKLLALLQDDRLRHKYAKAGYAAVLRRHSSETAQNQYLTAFGIQGCSRA